jgi:hypothetical protein
MSALSRCAYIQRRAQSALTRAQASRNVTAAAKTIIFLLHRIVDEGTEDAAHRAVQAQPALEPDLALTHPLAYRHDPHVDYISNYISFISFL